MHTLGNQQPPRVERVNDGSGTRLGASRPLPFPPLTYRTDLQLWANLKVPAHVVLLNV